jgi:hypothetical protein
VLLPVSLAPAWSVTKVWFATLSLGFLMLCHLYICTCEQVIGTKEHVYGQSSCLMCSACTFTVICSNPYMCTGVQPCMRLCVCGKVRTAVQIRGLYGRGHPLFYVHWCIYRNTKLRNNIGHQKRRCLTGSKKIASPAGKERTVRVLSGDLDLICCSLVRLMQPDKKMCRVRLRGMACNCNTCLTHVSASYEMQMTLHVTFVQTQIQRRLATQGNLYWMKGGQGYTVQLYHRVNVDDSPRSMLKH